MKTLKQTKLMDWVKMEQAGFYSDFHSYLSQNFNFWNRKFDNGEYIWFCCLNESCQAGFMLEYINRFSIPYAQAVKEKCLDVLMIVPKQPIKFGLPDIDLMSPEKKKEYSNSQD